MVNFLHDGRETQGKLCVDWLIVKTPYVFHKIANKKVIEVPSTRHILRIALCLSSSHSLPLEKMRIVNDARFDSTCVPTKGRVA